MELPKGVVQETLSATPKVGAEILVPDDEIDTQKGVMEIETSEGLRTPGVHFDVVGSKAVVMMDAALSVAPIKELNKESKSQRLSTYLSMRFNRTPAPQATSILTVAREVAPEGDHIDTQTQVE